MNSKSSIKAVVANSSWLIGESILTMIISLLVGIVSARYLGPENYGIINRFLPYITLANSICIFGMQSIIVREISKNHDKQSISKLLGSALAFRFLLSIISIIIINLYSFSIGKKEEPLLFIISALQSLSLIFNIYEIFTYYFHAELRSKYLAIATTITSIIIGLWKILLLITKANIFYFAFSTTLQSILMFALCFYYFKKTFNYRLTFSKDTIKLLVGDSYHLLLTSLGIALYGQVDKIMIGHQLGNIPLGYYSAAYAIATIWYFLPQAISNSLRSKIYDSVENEKEYNDLTRLLFMIITILGFLAGLGFSFLGNWIIQILYGKEYIAATSALLILGWVGLLANIGTAKSIWLVGKNLHKYTKWHTLMGAILNIILNFFLIKIWGINGAAISTVISQICVQFIFPLFFKNTREIVVHMICCFSSLKKIKQYFFKLKQ